VADPRDQNITSGDPLAGPAPEPRPETLSGVPGSEPATAPPPPSTGYGTGPVPPGAFTPPAPRAPAGGLAQPLRLAEWWRRALAAVVDGVIIGVASLVVLAIFGAVFSVGFLGGDTAGIVSVVVGLLLATMAIAIVGLLYAPLIMARTNGQTIGKQVFGIRVVRTDGQPVDFWWAALREVVLKQLAVGVAASFTFGIAWFVSFLWPLWDDENRAGHDFPVKSRVVMD